MLIRHKIFLALCLQLALGLNSNIAAEELDAATLGEVRAALDGYHEAMTTGNTENIMGFFSDFYNNSTGLSKFMLAPFLTDPGVLAVMKDQKVNMDKTGFSIASGVVSIAPITYEYPVLPPAVYSYKLKKEADGTWRLINSEVIQ